MSDCNCSYSQISYDPCNNGCCYDELDCMIANLKSELFERQQNVKDYCALESKCAQLENDIQAVCEVKNHLECELCCAGEEGNKLIFNLRTENENLKNELNQKNTMNKKLYGDNNNLFQALEGKTCDNQNLQDQMCHQEDILQRLNVEKINLQNTVMSLNQLKERHLNDIQNLNVQINLLNKNSDDLDTTLRSKNCQNMQIINEFNDAKNLNAGLVNELKNKECALMQIQQQLLMANETLSKLENDLNNLSCSHNKNKDDIACINSNLLNEVSIRNQTESNNAKLNSVINDRNILIQKLTNENNSLKCINTNINSDNNFLNSKIEAYKKHILIITNQNEKLSAELEAILSRDTELLYTLGRDSHLRAIQQENKNVINSSLDCLKSHIQCNSCLIPCETKCVNNCCGLKMSYNGSTTGSLHNSRIGSLDDQCLYEDGSGHSSGEEN